MLYDQLVKVGIVSQEIKFFKEQLEVLNLREQGFAL